MEDKATRMIRKIAVTGPESTGKSQLSAELAAHYDEPWVPEFAREYLDRLGRPYQESDIREIARGQLASEKEKERISHRWLFCDTELLVTKIWSEVRYGRCDPWILKNLGKPGYSLYLLCDIDLPWEYDPLREHPDRRQFLFNLYYKELTDRRWPFAVVRGTGPARLRNALGVLENFSFGNQMDL